MKRVILFLAFCFVSSYVYAEAGVRFLALSDIHFDPFIACYGKKGPCPAIQALQQAPASEWPRILSAYDVNPPRYWQDTGYPLLASSLTSAKKAAEAHHVQFVLILGDFLGHDYRRHFKKYAQQYSRANYHAFVKKTMEFLTNELSKTFPALDVYTIVGNNDSYSADYGFYPQTGFFSDMGALWSGLIKNDKNKIMMRQQFSAAGYYAVNISPSLKLIVLNSVLFSNKANGKGVAQAAAVELTWLKNELAKAQANKQRVFITMHVPPGIDIFASLKFRLFRMIDLWKTTDAEQYDDILQVFASQLAGIFAGHLHVDLMQVLRLSNQNSVPMLTVPSISPYFGNKPRFNIYIFSGETYKLKDIENFTYSLGNPGVWGGKLTLSSRGVLCRGISWRHSEMALGDPSLQRTLPRDDSSSG